MKFDVWQQKVALLPSNHQLHVTCSNQQLSWKLFEATLSCVGHVVARMDAKSKPIHQDTYKALYVPHLQIQMISDASENVVSIFWIYLKLN